MVNLMDGKEEGVADIATILTNTTTILANLATLLTYPAWTTQDILTYPAPATVPVTVATGIATWGAWTEIVPINTITDDFLITKVYLQRKNTSADGAIIYLHGELGEVTTAIIDFGGSFFHGYNADSELMGEPVNIIPFSVPRLVAANTQVQARLTDEGIVGAARDYGIRIEYIELPLV